MADRDPERSRLLRRLAELLEEEADITERYEQEIAALVRQREDLNHQLGIGIVAGPAGKPNAPKRRRYRPPEGLQFYILRSFAHTRKKDCTLDEAEIVDDILSRQDYRTKAKNFHNSVKTTLYKGKTTKFEGKPIFKKIDATTWTWTAFGKKLWGKHKEIPGGESENDAED